MGIARGEVDFITNAGFFDDGGEGTGRAVELDGRIAVLVLTREELAEDSLWLPVGPVGPVLEFGDHLLANGIVLEADQGVTSEALDPAHGAGGHSMSGGVGGCKCGQLFGFEPVQERLHMGNESAEAP